MFGIIWLFLALIVVLLALGVFVAGVRRPSGANPRLHHCANCRTPMSMRRVSWLKSLIFLAAWECQHCGTKSSALAWLSRSAPP